MRRVAGERVERDLDDDGTTDRIETYTYDENGNLTRAEFDDGADGMTDRAEDYSYNSDRRPDPDQFRRR